MSPKTSKSYAYASTTSLRLLGDQGTPTEAARITGQAPREPFVAALQERFQPLSPSTRIGHWPVLGGSARSEGPHWGYRGHIDEACRRQPEESRNQDRQVRTIAAFRS